MHYTFYLFTYSIKQQFRHPMGILPYVSNKNKNTIQVWYLNKDKRFFVPPTITMKQLKNQLDKINFSRKDIFLDWTPIDKEEENLSIQSIIEKEVSTYPQTKDKHMTIYVLDSIQEALALEAHKSRYSKIEGKLKQIEKIDSSRAPHCEKGKNGHIVFEDRHTAIFASGISYSLRNTTYHNKQKTESLIKLLSKQATALQAQNLSTIGKLFAYLGLLNEKDSSLLTSQNLNSTLQSLKSSTDFSDFDPKFVYYIAQIYLKFMLKSKCQISYIDYKDLDDYGIEYISSKSKIGIIGDFGTGLDDSIELLRNMVLKHGVDVILHLGDVYYAGTPQEYIVGITQPLKKLRIEAKRQIRFYSIPGNHDYYSWGLPFLCFVKSINEKEFHQQKASYFCMRDQQNKWQFLGMDTAFHDSNPLNQIYPFGVGPYVQQKQLKWHKHRLQNFPGSTILMSHHQLFSIHERINGHLTKYRKFSCINPMLCAEFFENMGDISGWFWGHEHSLMLFKENLLGLSKGRLLGNSSFHVMYGRENPYSRPKGFPNIPFITEDDEYLEKYLPLNPNLVEQDFFGLSYAIIDMERMDKETNNLPVQYWCSPSYSNQDKIRMNTQQQMKKLYFDEYKIYEETFLSLQSLSKQRKLLKSGGKVYLRCEIGLSLSVVDSSQTKLNNIEQMNEKEEQKKFNLRREEELKQDFSENESRLQAKNHRQLVLNLSASAFEIQFLNDHVKKHEHHHENHCFQFTLKLLNSESTTKNLYLSTLDQIVQLVQISDPKKIHQHNCIWVCEDLHYKESSHSNVDFFYGQPVKIHNKMTKKSLTWEIVCNEAFPAVQEREEQEKGQFQVIGVEKQYIDALWKFEKQNLIKE